MFAPHARGKMAAFAFTPHVPFPFMKIATCYFHLRLMTTRNGSRTARNSIRSKGLRTGKDHIVALRFIN
ncbi:hypothetical protein KDW07_09710, partial [Burkholderia dolosa]|nr:hypothetical protein [Burkholderia dolosa]